MLRADDLIAIIEIVNSVKDRVAAGNIDDLPVREDTLHAFLEDLPLHGAVEVVGHEEAAAQQVIAQLMRLCVRDSPFAHLHGIKPGPVIYVVIVIEAYRLFNGADMNAGQAAHREHEMPVRARIILGPQGAAFTPVTFASRTTIIPPPRIHQRRNGPLRFLLIIGRKGNGAEPVFNAGVLRKSVREGPVERESRTNEHKRASEGPHYRAATHPYDLAPSISTSSWFARPLRKCGTVPIVRRTIPLPARLRSPLFSGG